MKRVLFISQEVTPYLPETEISKVSRYLPQYIQEGKDEVRLFMPRYGQINERRHQLHEVKRLTGINMNINNSDYPLLIKVASLPSSARMQVYFIDNDDFFKRKEQYGHNSKGVNDNDERSIFFVRGVIEAVKKLSWIPDLVHCHGWFTSLGMIYLRRYYKDDPHIKKAKYVVSIYDEQESMQMPETLIEKLKYDGLKPAALAPLEGKVDYISLMKLAIFHSDGVIQGSEHLAPELLDYIQELGKPLLPYPGAEDYTQKYNSFYDQILEL